MSGRTVSFGFLTLCLAFLATLAQAVKFDLAPSSKPRESFELVRSFIVADKPPPRTPIPSILLSQYRLVSLDLPADVITVCADRQHLELRSG